MGAKSVASSERGASPFVMILQMFPRLDPIREENAPRLEICNWCLDVVPEELGTCTSNFGIVRECLDSLGNKTEYRPYE